MIGFGPLPRVRQRPYFPVLLTPTERPGRWTTTMYPPSSQYSLLPTDPEDIDSPADPLDAPPTSRPISSWLNVNSFRTRRFAFLAAGSLIVFILAGLYWRHVFQETVVFPEDWLDTPPAEPTVLRIAVITRVDGFERRKAVREAMFKGVRKEDVTLDYRFFVGAAPKDTNGTIVHRLVEEENKKFNDIVMLDKIDDIPERLSEKRYAALKWAASVSNATYDYFMTLDSDTFVRFVPLARRLPELYGDKKVNPREQPVLIGRMSQHLTYFIPTIPDGNTDPNDEDAFIRGPWFLYPAGIGYMMSSSLVNITLSTDPPLPHHIHYPSDDVMIGSWIGALRLFNNDTIEWNSTEHSGEPIHHVHPKPFLPYSVDTLMIDDVQGWHDFPGRGGHDAPISWNSVCTHHITAVEMKGLRKRLEFLGEWK
ncbi:galactosyltransferase-domain-containing protein [Gymnopilus junonius]|uniref:Hexosyltransferase n=1 Tax=Gymnopilus junonius TaxID=109634 RepID=A0A9P5TNP5_GYMJU|nr:galactosyltransferase-domain-containing protein [Gymnopilus junonius]